MARLPRYFVKGQPQHIIVRGNNREPIFGRGKADYQFYLDCLQKAIEDHNVKLHAYVLMTNHVHMLASPMTQDSLPKALQSIGRRYVQYFNRCYNRTGTLWEGRYKATVIDSEQYLLICSRYIELNPVRANMVNHPNDYEWSSYHYNAGGVFDPLITPHALYKRLGKTDHERRHAYRQLFKAQISTRAINDIRESTNKGWALGNDRFKAKLETLGQRRVSPKARGRPRKDH